MKKLKNILHGWWLFMMDTKESAALRDERKVLCDVCWHKSALNTCKLCGCFLPAKQRVKDEECPINEW